MADTVLTGTRMLTVAVAAEMVFQLVGANMSSPQTAELNAHARAPTLAKWLHITNVDAVAWTLFFCFLDRSLWPALGGGLAALEMHYKYRYAIGAGLESKAPGTENYATGGGHERHAGAG